MDGWLHSAPLPASTHGTIDNRPIVARVRKEARSLLSCISSKTNELLVDRNPSVYERPGQWGGIEGVKVVIQTWNPLYIEYSMQSLITYNEPYMWSTIYYWLCYVSVFTLELYEGEYSDDVIKALVDPVEIENETKRTSLFRYRLKNIVVESKLQN